MSSLTMKGKASEHAPLSSANANTSTPVSSNMNSAMDIPDVVATHGSSSIKAADQAAPPSPTSTDGWGELENGLLHEDHDSDKEGWDDISPLEEQKPAPLASIQAAQKRPVVQPKLQATQPKPTRKLSGGSEDDLWGAVPAPAQKTASKLPGTSSHSDGDLWGSTIVQPQKTAPKPSNAKPTSSLSDDLWGSIAAAPPKTTSKPLNSKISVTDDNDPWAAIAAPPPSTRAKPLSLGRGRGTKPAAPKLGAQRLDRTSTS